MQAKQAWNTGVGVAIVAVPGPWCGAGRGLAQ